MPRFLGFWSNGPDENAPSESPRDYHARNTGPEAYGDRLLAIIRDPNTTPEQKREARRVLEDTTYEVLPYPRKTGRRIWSEGEGFIPEYRDDRDVVSGGSIARAITADLAKGKR